MAQLSVKGYFSHRFDQSCSYFPFGFLYSNLVFLYLCLLFSEQWGEEHIMVWDWGPEADQDLLGWCWTGGWNHHHGQKSPSRRMDQRHLESQPPFWCLACCERYAMVCTLTTLTPVFFLCVKGLSLKKQLYKLTTRCSTTHWKLVERLFLGKKHSSQQHETGKRMGPEITLNHMGFKWLYLNFVIFDAMHIHTSLSF